MKKVLVYSLVSLSLLLSTKQHASAWSKSNFGVGMNIYCEKANTSCLGGLFKNGPFDAAGGAVDGSAGAGYAPPGSPIPPLPPIPPQGLPAKHEQPANSALPVSYNNNQYYQTPYGDSPYAVPQQAYPNFGYSGWNGR